MCTPGDYAGALHELPPKLLSMFVSAFQSYLFNRALSQRYDDGFNLTEAQPGDRLLFANGRTDTTTISNLVAVSLHLKRGRCGIALFMPGKDPFTAKTSGERRLRHSLLSSGIPRRILPGHPRLCTQNSKGHGA
jgi:tRNA pseudouridine13 synthase